DGRVKFIEEQWEILRDADDIPVTAVGTSRDITRRTLAEASQRESEERLRLLFEQMKDGFYYSTPDGRLLDINPAMIEMFGYSSREEMLKVNVTRDLYFSPEDRGDQTRDEGKNESEVYRMRRKDGSVIWVEDRGEYKYDEDGNIAFHQGILRDVTERKTAEERLVRSEEQYRDLVENSREMICTHDLEGRLLSVNRAAAEVLGYNPMDDGGGKNLRDILVPEFRDQFADYLARIRRDGFAEGLMFILTSTGQRRIWEYHNTLRTEGVAVPTVRGMARDITDIKRAKNERRVIFEIIQGSITSPNLDEFLKLIHRLISQLVSAENCFVMLHDPATDVICFEFWVDKHDPHPPPKIRGKGYASYVLATGQPLRLTPKAKKELQEQGMAEQIGSSSASWLGVPLRTPHRTIGVLVVQHYDDEQAYDQHDLEFLSSVGDQIALAIERKRAEEDLNLFRTLIDRSSDAIEVIDPETGRFLDVNEKGCSDLGYSREEFLSLKVFDIDPGVDESSFTTSIGELRRSGLGFWDGFHRRKDGTLFPVEVSIKYIQLERAYLVSSVRDITERKLAEARSRAFATLSQKLSGAVTRLDAGRMIAETARELLTWDACNLDLYDAERDLLDPMLNVDLIDGKPVDVTSRTPSAPLSARDQRVIEFGAELTLREDPIQFDKGAVPFGDTVRPSASIMSVPVRNASKVIGLLSIHSYTPRAYDAEALIHLQSLADYCGEAINRIQAEQALEQSEEQYRDLVENAHDIIYSHDLEGNYTSVNAACEQITGYTAEEALSMSFADILAPGQLENAKEMIALKIRGENVNAYEQEIIAKDGRRITLEVNTKLVSQDGVPVGIQGIARDITQRKLDSQAIKEADERAILDYEQLLERVASLALVLGNARELKPIFQAVREFASLSVSINGMFVTQFDPERGLRSAAYAWSDGEEVDITTLPPLEMVDSPNSRAVAENKVIVTGDFQSAMKGKPVFNVGLEIDPRLPQSSLAVPMSVMGRVVGAIEIQSPELKAFTMSHATAMQMAANLAANAIDNVRLMDAERLQAEQLMQSQKLESVGRLAGGVAHDFNNMLTAINGYSDLTLRKLEADDPLRRNVEEIKKAGERAASLTNQLLAFSRSQVLHPVLVDINFAITDIGEMLKRLIGEDVDLSTQLSPTVGTIKIDPGQFSQVVMNLAVNARDAMPKGGKLSIGTSNIFLDPENVGKHLGILAGEYVMLTVSDTGTGIPAEILDQIFEPFFTTKKQGKGTGLGLATVYGIIKQSGGGIFVYSEIGHGTTFQVVLPRVADKADARKQTGDLAANPATGSETILLVEDEEIVRSLSRQFLEECGYNVIEASNGVEALEIFEKSDVPIDLVLTDVVMPQMGGRELTEKLLAAMPDLPILLASGYTGDAVGDHGLSQANVNFIQKPFSLDGLARKVRDLLDSRESE
ncbi:MAG: PAS domain S-box protein, partial [Blastocatellia bacterium]|nr:PAS domain S-box protein [Blastocatellia bacterium]